MFFWDINHIKVRFPWNISKDTNPVVRVIDGEDSIPFNITEEEPSVNNEKDCRWDFGIYFGFWDLSGILGFVWNFWICLGFWD